MKKLYILCTLCIVSCAVVIAKDKNKDVSPSRLPGMQGFEFDDSSEELLFSPEELSKILDETQGGSGKKQTDADIDEMLIEPIEEDPEKVSREILDRILEGMDVEPADRTMSKPSHTVPKRQPVKTVEKKAVPPVIIPEELDEEDFEIIEIEEEEIDEPIKEVKPIPVKPAPQPIVKAKPKPKPKPTVKPIVKAKKAIKQARSKTEKGESHFHKGVALYAQRELRKAIKEFELALDENEEDAESYYMLADIYYQLYDIDNAWKNIRIAVNINGGKKNPLYKTIKRERHPQQAVPVNIIVLFVISMIMFSSGTLWFMRKKRGVDAIALEEIKNLKKEIEILKMKNDIQDPRVRYYRAVESCENGNTMLSLDNLKSAEEEFHTAIVLYPQVVNAYLGLGYIHFVQKKYKSAITDYAKALDIDPNSASAYYGIGRSLGENGDKKSQIEKIRVAAELDPAFREATEALQYLQGTMN